MFNGHVRAGTHHGSFCKAAMSGRSEGPFSELRGFFSMSRKSYVHRRRAARASAQLGERALAWTPSQSTCVGVSGHSAMTAMFCRDGAHRGREPGFPGPPAQIRTGADRIRLLPQVLTTRRWPGHGWRMLALGQWAVVRVSMSLHSVRSFWERRRRARMSSRLHWYMNPCRH